MKSINEILEEYKQLPEFSNLDLKSINCAGITGDTPLHVACHREDIEEVNALLEAGANPNVKGELGYTPMHIAVLLDNLPIARSLLAAGARIDLRNSDGASSQDIAGTSKMGNFLTENAPK